MNTIRTWFAPACSSFILFSTALHGQPLWGPLEMGLSFGGPRCLLEDQQADILYVSGAMSGSVAGVTSPGILTWDGISFSAMDCGFNWDCVSPLSGGGLANGGIGTMAFWNGELYAGGVGGRKTTKEKGAKTSLCWLIGDELKELAELPCGDDNSYPGFVELSPTKGLISWYSSHEKDGAGKMITAIYMAELTANP